MAAPRRNDFCPPADPIVTGDRPIAAPFNCYREDGLKEWLLTYTAAGRPWFRMPDGSHFSTTKGDLVLIPPNVRHDYGASRGDPTWSVLWLVFRPTVEWEMWLTQWPSAGTGHFRLSLTGASPNLRKKIISHLRAAHHLATGDSQHRQLLAMNALEAALIWADTINPRSASARMDQRVRRAVEFIRSKLSHRIGLVDIAAACGLSAPHLSRLFRQAMKTTPMAFLEAERMGRAQQLLDLTPLTVQSIAWEVGFESPFYFATRFRQHTGRSPRAYRQSRV